LKVSSCVAISIKVSKVLKVSGGVAACFKVLRVKKDPITEVGHKGSDFL
jgi:hypothetical protein